MSVTAPKVLQAISFAAFHHRHQLRKDQRTPYAAHPMRVTLLVAVDFGMTDPDVLAAAVLHDTIEDTNADCDDIIERFGERVASMVAALTKDKRLPEEERERKYFEGLMQAPPEVKLVKVADTLDNLLDSGTISGAGTPTKHLKKAREILENFEADVSPRWPQALERLRTLVETMETGAASTK